MPVLETNLNLIQLIKKLVQNKYLKALRLTLQALQKDMTEEELPRLIINL